jgi:thiol-disulfide isomerase/thioredoxin
LVPGGKHLLFFGFYKQKRLTIKIYSGPCKMIAPFFQQLASKYREVIFAKIDTDEAKEVAAACKVASL